MQIKFFPDHIHIITSEADLAAKRLQRRLGLPVCDREDLRQDLLIDLLRRLPSYNAERGSLGAFSGLILRNQSSRIAMRIMRQRRAQGGGFLSLDAPMGGGDHRPMSETIPEDEGLSTWLGQTVGDQTRAEDRQALTIALGHLPESDLKFCTALASRSIASLAREGFGSRSALYRRLSNLRFILTAHGLGPAWDEMAAA